MSPFISIITPVKDESGYIVECVNSLLHLDYPKDSYEIIVVLDRKASEDVKTALRTFSGNIRVLQSPKSGSAANRNLGASKASKESKYLAFIDADCIASKGWLKDLAERMDDADDDIGCIGGLNLVPESDNGFAKLVGAIEQTLLGGGGSAQSAIAKRERFVPSIPNCNALYRKRLWKDNRQDERLIIGQDGEFNYRLSRQGNKFLVMPGAVVWHHRTRTFMGYVRRMYKYGVAAGRITRMHPGILRARWYALMSIAGMLIAAALLISSIWSPAGLHLFLCLMALYLVMLAAATIKAAVITRRPIALLTPVLLFLQHSLYNIGFFAGLSG